MIDYIENMIRVELKILEYEKEGKTSTTDEIIKDLKSEIPEDEIKDTLKRLHGLGIIKARYDPESKSYQVSIAEGSREVIERIYNKV